jgi:hypothetical protein
VATIGALATLVVACDGTPGRGVRRRTSPFALFGRNDMRAGLQYAILEGVAKRESVKQYECVPLWAKARRCSLGIATGTLSAIVDSAGQVIRLSVSPDGPEYPGTRMFYYSSARQMRDAWDSLAIAARDDGDVGVPQVRWLDPTRRWGASMWYGRRRWDLVASATLSDIELNSTSPDSVAITDLPAYSLFMQVRPSMPNGVGAPRVAASTAAPAPTESPSRDEILTMIRSDLRALCSAQEDYLHSTGVYSTSLARLHLTTSSGVLLDLVEPTQDGWSAVATHAALAGGSCVVYAGDVAHPPATHKRGLRGGPGEVVCDP